jgi:opacity protein-like surface antigen
VKIFLLFLTTIALLATPIFAQNFQAAVGYSYAGTQHSGVEGSLQYNLNSTFGIKADVAGYFPAAGGATLFTAGPVVKFSTGKFQPFAEALVGLSYASKTTGNQTVFATQLGGGIDYALSKSVSFRPIEVDYVWTDFGNSAVSNSTYKATSGLVFNF